MKLFVLLAFSLLSSLAHAVGFPVSEVSLTCEAPNIAFYAHTENGKVNTMVSVPFGLEYAGIFKGILSPVSLPKVTAQYAILQKLIDPKTNTISFNWPIEECFVGISGFNDGSIINCGKGEHMVINGVKIRPITFRTTSEKLALNSGVFDMYNVSIVFLVEDDPTVKDQMFYLTSDYSFAQNCY